MLAAPAFALTAAGNLKLQELMRQKSASQHSCPLHISKDRMGAYLLCGDTRAKAECV